MGIGKGPEPERRNVDRDQRTRGQLGQPAQAFERSFNLAHACIERRRELPQRVVGENAVGFQSVPILKSAHRLNEAALVAIVGGSRDARGQLADEPQALAQRYDTGIRAAGPKRRSYRHVEFDNDQSPGTPAALVS